MVVVGLTSFSSHLTLSALAIVRFCLFFKTYVLHTHARTHTHTLRSKQKQIDQVTTTDRPGLYVYVKSKSLFVRPEQSSYEALSNSWFFPRYLSES